MENGHSATYCDTKIRLKDIVEERVEAAEEAVFTKVRLALRFVMSQICLGIARSRKMIIRNNAAESADDLRFMLCLRFITIAVLHGLL